MLNEMMNNSMAPVAEVGARQVQGLGVSTGSGQDSRGTPTDTSFALAMSNARMGTVSETTGVSMAVSATSQRVGESDLPQEGTGELDPEIAEHDADGDGQISADEVMDAIVLGIGMGAVTETGKTSQKAVSEAMTNARRLQNQILNNGRFSI